MDLRRASPVWDEEFDKLTRSMQERMDGFFRTPGQVDPGCSDSGRTGRIERQPDGSLVYRVVFDVRDYEPGDLKTSLVGDRTVRVCGNSKRVDPRTGKQSSASFDEQFSLPDGVDPRGVRSTVAEGQLSVTAPVMPPSIPGSSRPCSSRAGSTQTVPDCRRGRVRPPSPSLSARPDISSSSRAAVFAPPALFNSKSK
uniref:SHSP domain-containing protein n=1 Tax=Macrostomum lignano TaxID=282301 RepID=A0A1I8IW86_9PLAT